jgi:hypothetical protein
MQIKHTDQNKKKAYVSLFFDYGDEDSDFLKKIGFDPSNNQQVTDLLFNLGKN